MLFAFGNCINVRLRLLGLIYVAIMMSNGVAAQYEFDACELQNGSAGICRVFQECQELIEAIKRNKSAINDPTRCGFKGNDELICCPGSGGNIESKGGQLIFGVDATTEKSIDYSASLLPTITTTTAKPDFWLHLLNSTTTPPTTTTTAKPDFWLHLLSSTTTTSTSTTTTTTPKPLVVDGQELATDVDLYDFSKLLNQNKKSENLQLQTQNPSNLQPNFSENMSENWAANSLDNPLPNMPQSANVNGVEKLFVPGNEFAGNFGNAPGPSFANGRGHRQRNGFGIGFSRGQGRNGFSLGNNFGNGFVNDPRQQGLQFQNQHINNPGPPQNHNPFGRSNNQFPAQFQQPLQVSDRIGANIFTRPSAPQTFNRGNVADFVVGKSFSHGRSGRGNQFRNHHINNLGPLQSPPLAANQLPFQFQQPTLINEQAGVNAFLTSPQPNFEQNNIDMSGSNKLFFDAQASAVRELPNGQIWNNQNQNVPAPNPLYQDHEGAASEFQPHFYDNVQNIFNAGTTTGQPTLSNPFLPFEQYPQANENLSSSAANNVNAENIEQFVRQGISSTKPKITTTSTSKQPLAITRTERPSVAACRVIEDGLTPMLSPHILDGTPVAPGEYPHMAAIGYSEIGNEGGPYDFRCGGALIHERFVLTAAHCVNSRNVTPAIIRLGMSNFDDPDELAHRVEMPVKTVSIHPNYSNSRKYDDIAVLELQRAVPLGEFIYPTCLYTDLADPPADSKLYVSGWGTVDTRTRKSSRILLKARLQIEPLDNCNSSYVEYGLTRQLERGLERTQLCARDPGFTKDACQGDSGGPLNMVMDESTKSYRIVGVISTGFGCASAIPGLYTRVASYLDFIEAIVWPTK